MQIHQLPPAEVYRALGTSPAGLTEAEVEERRGHFGPNILESEAKPRLLQHLLGQFTHFLALLLWLAAGLCFLLNYLNPDPEMITLGVAIIAVICVNALFAFFQEYRAEKAMAALRRLLPVKVRVIRGGKKVEIAAAEVVVGEVVLLEEGDQVPADARLVECQRLQINLAALTGEADPRSRTAAAETGVMLESPNLVFAGANILSGSGRAVVFAVGPATEFGRVAHLTTAIKPQSSPLLQEINRASKIIAVLVTIIGVMFFGLNRWLGRPFWESLIFGIGILVAMVPEGLLPTVSLALAMGSQRLAQRRALVRTLTKVETLGSATVICTDKTGTLTQNRMRVERVYLNGQDLLPNQEGPGKNALWDPTPARHWLEVAYFCNNAEIGREGSKTLDHGDPTEIALKRFAQERGMSEVGTERLAEIPFEAERKRMTVIQRLPNGEVLALVKGAPEIILPRCSRYLSGEKSEPLWETPRQEVAARVEAYAGEALRVLALAYRPLAAAAVREEMGPEIENDLIFVGLVGLLDPPRPEVPAAVERCRQAGIRLIMITGDKATTARAIGRLVGLDRGAAGPIWEGPEVERLSQEELRSLLTAPELILARMTPRQKLRVVMTLKEMQEVVAVTGDGVNDAPALKAADIGIAMGLGGTEVAKAAADLILLDDNFATIVNAIEEGRAIFSNIQKFIIYILTHNIAELMPFIAYVLFRLPLPLTVMQVLAIDLGTDILPALALAAEPPEPGVMARPPRARQERLLAWPVMKRAYLFLGPLEAAVALTAFFWIYWQSGWRPGMAMADSGPLYLLATSYCFAAIIVSQMGNLWGCRTDLTSTLHLGLRGNWLLIGAWLGNLPLIAALFYLPWLQDLFGTYPLDWTQWLGLAPGALLLLLSEELRKALKRRQQSRQAA